MIRHLGCIMDGNRRWAKKNSTSLKDGVLEGLARIETAVDFCIERNIEFLSLYTFSIENLKRSVFERACYFGVLLEYGHDIAQKMIKKGVRIRFIGNRGLFPQEVVDMCNAIEAMTANCSKLSVQLLFCYGGRQEIVEAAKNIALSVQQGNIALQDVTEELFKNYTWTSDLPDPELIIRTGNMNRLSGFLLYQSAYSELYFPTCLWPDMHIEEFSKALDYYDSCTRNFGL